MNFETISAGDEFTDKVKYTDKQFLFLKIWKIFTYRLFITEKVNFGNISAGDNLTDKTEITKQFLFFRILNFVIQHVLINMLVWGVWL